MRITVDQSQLTQSRTRLEGTAAKGDLLEVRLELKATGYTWKLKNHDPNRLKPDGEVTTESQDKKPGGREYKVFRFQVLDEGDLDFQLARPFGNPDPKDLRLHIELAIVRITVDQSQLTQSRTRLEGTAAKGDLLEVRLELKATGYTWKLKNHDPNRLKPDGEVTTESQDKKPGGREYKVFRFQVLDEGDLDFQLARPFGNPDPKDLRLHIELAR
ncbi:protease inhibitor I42 family protein [Paludisphaera mucosa]|uniref:Protease inhibitor I42 family protein n=1 Tax=Paludisphaera mucosa TaxID=3030827 RepID=A0ABT6FCV5_9BACT|nr:protease inhibitor I42 family protein [Paludisphaera mucosa]